MVERLRHLPSGQRILFFVGVVPCCLVGYVLSTAMVGSDVVQAVIDLVLVVIFGWVVVVSFQRLLINQVEKESKKPRRRRRRR